MRSLILGIILLPVASGLAAQREGTSPGDILRLILVDGGQSIQMKDIIASRRSRAGFYSSSKQYFYFDGPRSAIRTRTTRPEFEFDADASDDDPIYLFRFDRKSDRREITVASGFGGLSEFALPRDHIIATAVEQIGGGQGATRRYRLKPLAPLRPGEYCVTRNISVCFDFGVD